MEKKAEAKKKVLGSLSDEMRNMMGEGLKEKMMKVTVAGKDEKSVEKGLDKAKEILKKKIGPMEDDLDEMDEVPCDRSPAQLEEDYADENEEEEENDSPDDIKAKIEELQKKLASLKE